MARGLGVLAALIVLGSCSTSSVFQCTGGVECSVGGQAGFCDAPGYCSFEDAACPSGRRFGSLAGMGLADECVPGSGTSTGVADPSESSSTVALQTSSSSSTTAAVETSSSSGTTGVGSESSAGPASSSSSSSGGLEPVCTLYDFEGRVPFSLLDPESSLDVQTSQGTLLAQWMPTELGGAGFVVVDPADVLSGSIEVELSVFPEDTGTLLAASWEDAAGYVISAIVDGPSFVISHYDPVEDATIFPSVQPHGGRTRLRMRSVDTLVVIDAAGVDGFEPIATLDTAETSTVFDPTEVEVRITFNRYQSGGIATSIAIESVTNCANP